MVKVRVFVDEVNVYGGIVEFYCLLVYEVVIFGFIEKVGVVLMFFYFGVEYECRWFGV